MKELKKYEIRMNKNIDKLTVNKTFNLCVKTFYDKKLFSGPSVYFHKKVIELIRQNIDYDKLVEEESFLEYIYATLVSWGMHSSGAKRSKDG